MWRILVARIGKAQARRAVLALLHRVESGTLHCCALIYLIRFAIKHQFVLKEAVSETFVDICLSKIRVLASFLDLKRLLAV